RSAARRSRGRAHVRAERRELGQPQQGQPVGERGELAHRLHARSERGSGGIGARIGMDDRQAEREQRVTPLELFFDLVVVFAITQVTSVLSHSPTWGGLLRGLLLLGALWWAWAAYAWLTNTLDPEEGVVRLAVLAAIAAML